MPRISYEARGFAYPIPTWRPHPVGNSGHAHVTRADLAAHAMTVGDISVLTGSPTRRKLDARWRAAAVLACVEESKKDWTRAPEVKHLDSSEKGFMGYLLGMTQASVMSEHILGAVALVHVDAVLRQFGALHTKKKRPDLIGYMKPHLAANFPGPPPPARILVEAKGTTGGRKKTTIKEARAQIKPGSGSPPNPNLQQLSGLLGPNALRVVSYAYFNSGARATPRPVWRSYLEDPPSDSVTDSDWTDDQFRGLVIASKLLPLYEECSALPPTAFPWPDRMGVELRTVRFGGGMVVGFPDPLARVFDSHLRLIPSRVGSPEQIESLQGFSDAVSEAVPEPAKLLPYDPEPHLGWEVAKMRSGFSVAFRLLGDE